MVPENSPPIGNLGIFCSGLIYGIILSLHVMLKPLEWVINYQMCINSYSYFKHFFSVHKMWFQTFIFLSKLKGCIAFFFIIFMHCKRDSRFVDFYEAFLEHSLY